MFHNSSVHFIQEKAAELVPTACFICDSEESY